MRYDYHVSCRSVGCEEGCCNYYGECPSHYEGWSYPHEYTSCHYFYNISYSDYSERKWSTEGIVGVSVGTAIILLAVVIGWLIYRTRAELRENIQIMITSTAADMFDLRSDHISIVQYEVSPSKPLPTGSPLAQPSYYHQEFPTSHHLIYQQDYTSPSLTPSDFDMHDP